MSDVLCAYYMLLHNCVFDLVRLLSICVRMYPSVRCLGVENTQNLSKVAASTSKTNQYSQ